MRRPVMLSTGELARFVCPLWILVPLVASAAGAAAAPIDAAVGWLAASQRNDGGWSDAISVQATTEVVSTLRAVAAGTELPKTKRLVGFVAGLGTVYKIDIAGRRVISKGLITDSWMYVARYLWLPTDKSRLYMTAEQAAVPVKALDPGSLDIAAELNLPNVPPAKPSVPGRFNGTEFCGSGDGSSGLGTILDLDTGQYWLQLMSLPALVPNARIQGVRVFNPGPHTVALKEDGKFVTFYSRQNPSGSPERFNQYIGIIDSQRGVILQEKLLPQNLQGNVPASQFLPEAVGLYLVQARIHRCCFPGKKRSMRT